MRHFVSKKFAGSLRKAVATRRGMALLLVMIGMVVCTILTAGFLSTQGTSIGIARNERDASKCHAIAQTGIDMCYWLIKNKSDWRETMTPGTWLTNTPIGEGTVTVSVADGDGTNNFADDPTQPVTITSTGTFDSRNFTLTATLRPTGGGTVFRNGNFISGKISVGNGDLITAATIDSYNSSVASYNALSPGSNAAFGSNSIVNDALTVYFPSVFRGSYAAAPLVPLTSVLNLVGLGSSGPSSTSSSQENRYPGTVIFPNTTGLGASHGNVSPSSGTTNFDTPGVYDDVTANGATLNFSSSGVFSVNNLTLSNSSSFLNVPNGKTVVLLVRGNASINAGKVTLNSTGQLAIYLMGNLTVSGGWMNNLGSTSHLTIFGGNSGGNIQITNTGAIVYGSIYAPQHAMTMQNNSPKFYGAVIAASLTLKNSSALHFDEALRSLKISNITGGSASPGTADYRLIITGGPGVVH